MKLKHIMALAALLPLPALAQTITFDTEDYASLGVYDTWEASPFRTGALQGNYAVIDNHLNQVEEILGTAPNPSAKILAVQRSRFGSNTFGVRVNLKEPFELTPTTKYIHLLINRPYAGRVMVVGLGKRRDRAGQSPDTEQFWAMTTSNVPANRWQEVVLAIKGNGGIDIGSLVIVPDCESPHAYTADEVCYIDQIEINTNPSASISYEPYPVNFDKGQAATRNDRWLNSFSLKADSETPVSFTLPTSPKRVYNDMTEKMFYAKAGQTITTNFAYSGSWMHGYVYIDRNSNGKFEAKVNDDYTRPEDSELMAYSFYGENESGKNSNGVALTGAARNVLNPPTFTIPADLAEGIYRLRAKVDWNSADAGGNPDPDQLITANGGNIVDILLNVHGDYCSVSDANRNGEVLTADGQKLNSFQAPFGQPFTIKMNPENGFEYAGIIVKHGYNLSGDSLVNGNVQWKKVRYSRTLFNENDEFTIPAECMDGTVEIEGLFIEQGTYHEPTRYITTVVTDEAFADTTSWYTIQIGTDGYVLADNGSASYIALNNSEIDIENPAHLWCFTGNENVGYNLYNKQAGPTKVLAAPTTMTGTTGGTSYPVMKEKSNLPTGYTATWRFMDSNSLGSTGNAYAYMYEDGYEANKVNNRDNKLAFWTGGQDAGSTLRIFFACKDGTESGIRELTPAPKAEGKAYDLSGRRVSNPQKGIYIIDNKLVYKK